MATAFRPQMSFHRRCPANCKCTKCRLAAAKQRRPSEDELRAVVERITLNHQRRRPSSPINLLPPPHQCPCGLTFGTSFYLKAHIRNVHNGKVPDYPSYVASEPFLNEGSSRKFPPHNPTGAATDLSGNLRTGNVEPSYGFALPAPNTSEYQIRAGVETKATSSRQEATVKISCKEDSDRKGKAPISKSVSKLPGANSQPAVGFVDAVSTTKQVGVQSTVSFRCSQCLKLFPSRENLDVHFVRWHGTAPLVYPCSYRSCEREFQTLSARNTHVKTFHEPNDAFEYNRLLEWHNLNNLKRSKAVAKSGGNESVSSQRVTSADCYKNLESNDVIGTPSVDNLAQDCPSVKSANNLTFRESFGSGDFGNSPSTVSDDAQNSTNATNLLGKSLASKINWIFNTKVANKNRDNSVDPIATPLDKNYAQSMNVVKQPDNGNVTKQPCDTPSLVMIPADTEPVHDVSSDSDNDLQDPLPIFSDDREISTTSFNKEPRNQNVVASSSTGSAKKPSFILVKSKREVIPKVQTSNLSTAKRSAVVANERRTVKSTEPSNVKKTRADKARSSGTSGNKKAPVTKQGSVNTNSQSLNPVMGPTRVDYDLLQPGHHLRPRQQGVVAVIEKPQGLQKVRYIDIEGNLASMVTKVDNPSPQTLYLCNICDAWFPGNAELVLHREENHVPKGTVKCKRCHRMFMTEALADCHAQFAHIEEIHKEILANAAVRRATLFAKFWEATKRRAKREKREPWKEGEIIWEATNENRGHYLCLICDKNFDVKLLLNQHNIAVHNKADFMCDLCGKLLGSLKGVERHRLVCSQPKTLISCHICNKKLSDPRKMTIHIARSHSNIRNFECDVCKKRFNQIYNLRFHIKTQHNGERKYHTCPKCKKVFTALNSVRLHDIAAHQAYDCNFCDATVIGKAELRDHVMANHRKTTSNKFACGTCHKTFNTKSSLVAHISFQHGIGDKVMPTKKPAPSKELIFCDVCGKAYVIKASMVRHMSVKHGFVESYFVGEKKGVKKAMKRKSGPSGKKTAGKNKAKKMKPSSTDSCIDSTSLSADVSLDSAANQAISDEASHNSFDVGNVVVQGSVVESLNQEINQDKDVSEYLPAVTHEIAKPSAMGFVPIDNMGASNTDVNMDPAAMQGTSHAAFQNTGTENAIAASFSSESNQAQNEFVISQVNIQEIAKPSAMDSVPIVIEASTTDVNLDPAVIQGTSDVAFQNIDAESFNSENNQTQNEGTLSHIITQEIAKLAALDAVPIDLGASFADVNLEPFPIQGSSNTAFQNTDAGNELVGSYNPETIRVETDGLISPAEGRIVPQKPMRRSVRDKKSASNFIEESNTDFMVRMIDKMCKRNE